MPHLDLAFPLAGGLHARPAAALRERALAHRAELSWTNHRTGRTASLRNVLDLLATETRLEDPCRLSATGPDAEAACRDLGAFLAGPFRATDAVEPSASACAGPGVPRLLARLGCPWWPAVPVASGLGEGPVRVLADSDESPDRGVASGDREAEVRRLRTALERLGATLEAEAARAAHPAQRAILHVHGAMLADEGWTAAMVRAIREAGLSAGAAIARATDATATALAGAGEALLRARALDLRGLGHRLRTLLDGPPEPAAGLEAPGVLVADLLTPTAFLALDPSRLRALVLGEGSATSHTAILARSFGIPCVALPPARLAAVRPGQPLLVDGHRGLVVPDPPPELSACLRVEQQGRETRAAAWAALARRPAATADGTPVKILANVAGAEEAARAFELGADGIGLFRTELRFLGREAPPTEDEQMEAYAAVLRAAGDRPVVLRLLDAGGDKPLPFLPLPPEANPFLGRRGVRWYAGHADLIRTQVRAALRAAPAGNLRLMVPLVTDPGELRWVQALIQACATGLGRSDPLPGLGMMVEIPATALCLEPFADAAFFSVGTNDLLQYLFAEDRGDPTLGGPARAWHPATLRLLGAVAHTARALGREVSLCGEAAADPRLLPLFLGLGFTAFSAAPQAIPALKAAVAGLDLASCRALAEAALRTGTSAEVSALLDHPAPRADLPLAAPDLVVLDEACATKEEAIRRLVERLACTGRAPDPDALEAAVWAREDAHPTGIGFGVAVPHGRAAGARGLALLRLQDGLDWGTGDGEAVRLVILLAGGDDEAHLRTFAALARRLMDPAFRAGLMTAPSAEALIRLLPDDLTR